MTTTTDEAPSPLLMHVWPLLEAGRVKEALDHLTKVIDERRTATAERRLLADALNLRGFVFISHLRDEPSCLRDWEEAYDLCPDDERYGANLLLVYSHTLGAHMEAASRLAPRLLNAVDLKIARIAHELLIFARQCEPVPTTAGYRDLVAMWSKRFIEPIARAHVPTQTRIDRGGGLRIGFVHYFFDRPPYAPLIAPLFEHLRRLGHDVVGISTHPLERPPVPRIAAAATDWLDGHGVADNVLASRIRALDLDTLVNLDGFSTTTRFDVFAEHPVPVQASWHNTHYSFGGRLFDRIVADKVVLSEAEASEYAETIVRLPDCYFAIEPLSWAPDVSPPPLASEGRVTFGTFNRPDKISDEAARCWSRIVNAVPNSRIYLRNGGFNHPGARDAIRLRLAKAGIDPLRIYIEGGADDAEFLNSYRHIDVALDTFPFNGGFTTYQALWQGVPLPAFCGERWAARVSFSILKAAGLDELLAADQPGYEELIIALAQDPDRLAALRQTIRARVAASPFTDMAGFARNFADALR